MSRQEGADIRMIHGYYRDSRYPNEESALLAAQIAIANVVRAYAGILSRPTVLRAIGNARTPNAVSLAVRTRLR